MTRVLSIGLGGLGVVASYTLHRNNGSKIELTAVIRSDYDVVTTKGYTLSSIDYGGRRENNDPDEENNRITGFKPDNVVKTLEEAAKHGPFDYIVVATKVVPGPSNNIWDEVIGAKGLLYPHKKTAIVLCQNGIGIEKYWDPLKEKAFLISGVSYISSTNVKGVVTQYGHDSVRFGYFDQHETDLGPLETFHKLYSNEVNSATIDNNTQYIRWRKLLYNSSINTVCCLTNSDVGQLYQLDVPGLLVIENVILPLMREIQHIANDDIAKNSDHKETVITDGNVANMNRLTREKDAPSFYQPSMLVDFRHERMIELDIILGNVLAIYKHNNPGVDVKKATPHLNMMYFLLLLVQERLRG